MPILVSNESSFKIKRPIFRRFCQKLSESPENAVGKFSEFWNFDFWLSIWYEVRKHNEIHNLSIFWFLCRFRILRSMYFKWPIFGLKWISRPPATRFKWNSTQWQFSQINGRLLYGFPKFCMVWLLSLSENFPKNQNSFFWFQSVLNR